jgi:DNA-binding MarR family transcriptional regulator
LPFLLIFNDLLSPIRASALTLPRRPYRSTNPVAPTRTALAERLRVRQPEIEQAIFTRVQAIADPSAVPDPEYLPGLKRAVSAAVDYSLLGVEVGERQLTPIPVPLLGQARVAARNDVTLNTVLQRCAAGYTVLLHFMEEEVALDGRLQRGGLTELRNAQVALLDRLFSALSDEHSRGHRDRLGSSQAILAQRVRRLLAGELVDKSEIPYDFDAYHIGVLTKGPEAVQPVRDLAKAFDCRLLSIEIDDDVVWAWLGTRQEIDRRQLRSHTASNWTSSTPLALGETNKGLIGWGLTHRQARAAFSLMPKRSDGVAQYGDVALLASMLQDDLLLTSLRQFYLAPLRRERDGGEELRRTLRAYFAAERNTSSAAAALGVSRRTVANRLRSFERRIDRPLSGAMAEIEGALLLADLDAAGEPTQEGR